MTDRQLAALHLPGAGSAPIAGATTSAAAAVAGLPDTDAGHLGQVVEAVCELVEETAFDTPAAAQLDITVRRHAHDVVVEIDDQGMPFNQAGIEAADARIVRAALQAGWIDEFDHYSRGRLGNRSVLVAHLDPGPDERDNHTPDEVPGVDAKPARVDDAAAAALTARVCTGEDAEGLARLTWRTYGYSYAFDEYYHPAQLRDMLDSEDYVGWVSVEPDGEIVGHLAAGVHRPGAIVADGGRGMTDPRYRGHGVMMATGQLMVEWMTGRGIIGIAGEAVTAHTMTQGGEDSTISGILLGNAPATVAFKAIASAEANPRRMAVALTYSQFAPQPELDVHLPEEDVDIVRRFYERQNLPRRIHSVSQFDLTGDAFGDDADEEPHLDVEIHRDRGIATFVVTKPTESLYEVLRDQMSTVLDAGAEVLYVSLPLSHPATPHVAHQLAWLGFFFGGISPYNAPDDGDALVYQRTGDIEVEPDDIKLASSFSREVLDHVLARKQAAGIR